MQRLLPNSLRDGDASAGSSGPANPITRHVFEDSFRPPWWLRGAHLQSGILLGGAIGVAPAHVTNMATTGNNA